GAGDYTIQPFGATEVSLMGPGSSANQGSLIASVEEVDLGRNAGAGNFHVFDLTSTAVTTVNILSQRLSLGGLVINWLQGTLTVDGTGGNDAIAVTDGTLLSVVGTVPTVTLPWGNVKFLGGSGTLAVNGLGGDDVLSDLATSRRPANTSLVGGDGNDTL